MKVIRLLLVSLMILTMSGCGKDKSNEDSRGGSPAVPQKPTDLSKLPIDQAIKVKYSKLNFKCDYKLVLLRPDKVGGVAKTVLEKQFYLWDLVNDFNKNAELELKYEFENVYSRVVWNVEVGMVAKATPGQDGQQYSSAYELTDAIVLKGTSLSSIKEFAESGTELGSSETQLNDQIYYDRIPMEVTNTIYEFADLEANSTQFYVNCMLDAEVKPGFESDYKVNKN
ncbi:MAG: hypothetical protein KDD58_11920 [Bdellovibrionales bacterium]|nr:hypothetical protein [Bdellovibrionales bacterium]